MDGLRKAMPSHDAGLDLSRDSPQLAPSAFDAARLAELEIKR